MKRIRRTSDDDVDRYLASSYHAEMIFKGVINKNGVRLN